MNKLQLVALLSFLGSANAQASPMANPASGANVWPNYTATLATTPISMAAAKAFATDTTGGYKCVR
jgi:hypothetical protein